MFLLALVPLICQICFVSWLFVQLWQMQSDLVRISRAMEVTSKLHNLVWEGVEGLYKMHIHSATLELADPEISRHERARFKKRINWLLETNANVGLCGKVINLCRLHRLQDVYQAHGVRDVTEMQFQPVVNMLDASGVEAAGTANYTVNLIILSQQ